MAAAGGTSAFSSLGCKMVQRILSGQPAALAVPATFHIRVSDAGRHDRRNRKTSSAFGFLFNPADGVTTRNLNVCIVTPCNA
jgi:hypothetical protein